MTILCSYCKKVNGEKCGGCGGTQLRVVAVTTDSHDAIYNCLTCGRTWIEGRDRETHGICNPPCKEAIKAGVKEKL
jgi:hypothetical protein